MLFYLSRPEENAREVRERVAIARVRAYNDGCTVVLVTHDPAVAEQADIVLQIKDGFWI